MNIYTPVYTKTQEIQIQSEFERTKDICYLEHAGATLYSEKQISDVLNDLASKLYANPHAKSTSSKLTEDSIDQIRYQILNHFNTSVDEYSVIFTNGATGALKLVAESFQYNDGCLVHLQDNHTSVLGMRYHATNVEVLTHDDAFDVFCKQNLSRQSINDRSTVENSLFVYPAQCNFTGTKYPLTWIEDVQNGALNYLHHSNRWFCCLDAAAFIATNFLDLSRYKPDFICLSFYKLFGYPTGLGALLVKKGSENVLSKKYYGGGTVLMALSMKNIAIHRTVLHERFEDGTIPFLSILSLKHGFSTLNRLNLDMDLISKHTFSLAKYVYGKLRMLHHSNGRPLAVLYHDTTFEDRRHQGGVVNFNLRRCNGEYIGYVEVMNVANLFGIQLRTGCFCNPGSCQRHLKLSTDEVVKQYEMGHVCGDQNDLICGIPTGSVRISFGYMSTKENADEFLNMIEECFVERPCIKKWPENCDVIRDEYRKKFYSSTDDRCGKEKMNVTKIMTEEKKLVDVTNENFNVDEVDNTAIIKGTLNGIYIYPVKSCGGFKIQRNWELVSTGLKYDRKWMVVDESGVCLTQKNYTSLCRIKTYVDLQRMELELKHDDFGKVSIPLQIADAHTLTAFRCRSKVCGDPIMGWDCGEEVSNWLGEVLNAKGVRLLKQSCQDSDIRWKKVKDGTTIRLSLSNQSQFLLINRRSVEWLQKFLIDDTSMGTLESVIARFRPNFVIDFEKRFIENDLRDLEVDGLKFKAAGKCTRCQIICVDQNTGEKSVDLLKVLSQEFHGKISFGIYLTQQEGNENNLISVNSDVTAAVNVT